MSRLARPIPKTDQVAKKWRGYLQFLKKIAIFITGISMIGMAHSVSAECQYVVTNQWNNGFTANIRITNSGNSVINGWALSWKYSGQDRIAHNWSSTLSGTNPYTAINMSWNSSIQPKQTIEIGFQGTKGTANAEIPTIKGAVCASATSSTSSRTSSIASSKSSLSAPRSSSSPTVSSSRSSVASSNSSSSVVSSRSSSALPRSSSSNSSRSSLTSSSMNSSPISSQRSSLASSSKSSTNSSVASVVNWGLDISNSYLNFVTTKNAHTLEVHDFGTLSGDIINGAAKLVIDLNSINSGVALRDQRMRDLLFQTGTYPTATVIVNLPANLISGIATGNSLDTDISAELDLHGIKAAVTTRVSVQRLSASRLVVQSIDPIIIKASDYSLTEGVEALRAAVGIASISTSVPVDFTLVFDAR